LFDILEQQKVTFILIIELLNTGLTSKIEMGKEIKRFRSYQLTGAGLLLIIFFVKNKSGLCTKELDRRCKGTVYEWKKSVFIN
jgi:hypothetical protein